MRRADPVPGVAEPRPGRRLGRRRPLRPAGSVPSTQGATMRRCPRPSSSSAAPPPRGDRHPRRALALRRAGGCCPRPTASASSRWPRTSRSGRSTCAARPTAPAPRPTCARPTRRSRRRSWRPPRPTRSWRRGGARAARGPAGGSSSGSPAPTLRLGEARREARPAARVALRLPPGAPPVNTSESAQPPGPSPRPAAATLEFREATKRYPGQTEPAVDRLSLRSRRARSACSSARRAAARRPRCGWSTA